MSKALDACNPTHGRNPVEKWGPLVVLVVGILVVAALSLGVVEPDGAMQRTTSNLLIAAVGGLVTKVVKDYQSS